MGNTERILITVKTYPTLSKKYGELVCTEGIRESGGWLRLYPVPFRLKEYAERYKKWDWVETRLVRSRKDKRPESFHPLDPHDMPVVGHLDTKDKWRVRRDIVLKNNPVHYELEPLIKGAHANELSLATFKPERILALEFEETDREWKEEKVHAIQQQNDQGNLFEEDNWQQDIKLMPKLPYKFFYRLEDSTGKSSRMQILDWEIGQLFLNCRESSSTEEEALEKVRAKYIGEFGKKDLHLFLGTTLAYHSIGPNPFTIIGVFPPPKVEQLDLF